MPFQLSPGVLVVEKDLTSIIPAVATSAGAFAGAFQWGPVDYVTTIESENKLAEVFGKPNDTVAPYFFTAANFLAYGNNLQVIRSVNKALARNATVSNAIIISGVSVVNGGTIAGGAAGNSNANINVTFSAPDLLVGNIQATGYAVVSSNTITSIVVSDPGRGYSNVLALSVAVTQSGAGVGFSGDVTIIQDQPLALNEEHYEGNFASGNGHKYGSFIARFPGALGNSLRVSIADATAYANSWAYASDFDAAPSTSDYVAQIVGRNTANDEVHVIVIDEDGLWTGTRNSVLEKFAFASKASDARKNDGSTNYYKDIINNQSKYIWWADHPYDPQVAALAGSSVAWGREASDAASVDFADLSAAYTVSLAHGVSADQPTDGNLISSFNEFSNDERYDISLIPAGPVSTTVADSMIGIAETRKDCVVFVSPQQTDVVNTTTQASRAVATRNTMTSSSYAVMDSGWKYQYDRYNDKYRWVPLNGDTAGLCARTDFTADPWFSPAGFNRGVIRNVVRLAYSPSKTDRDTLYKNGVNPVVSFPGQGTVLFGDKTMLSKPSAFDRINVRRLFIVLEKAIATASKFQLFEFNDAFTRAQFRNLVEPFLRDVQGRRGITDFKVVCDETNNTGEVIDRNEFVADIFIKPARSINFIQLNFIATRTGISFEEVGA